MDLRSLRYFIAVLEAGSLSRAAHSLFVAQPALTAQIKKLEAELGAQLLERTHAGISATPAGAQLYEDARRLLSDADAMRERIQHLPKGPEGSVTVAMPFLLTGLLMGPVIAELRHSHPRIRIFVLDNSSLMVRKAMSERRADLGIVVNTPSLQGVQLQALASEPIYFCGLDAEHRVAPLLYRAEADDPLPSIDFSHAAAQPLLLQSRRFSIRQDVEQAANELQLSLNIVHEHDSARVIRSLYLCGAGFTFSPACSIVDSPQPTHSQGSWIVAEVRQPDLQRHYHLARQPGRSQDAAVQVVENALLAEIRTLIAERHWHAQWPFQPQ